MSGMVQLVIYYDESFDSSRIVSIRVESSRFDNIFLNARNNLVAGLLARLPITRAQIPKR